MTRKLIALFALKKRAAQSLSKKITRAAWGVVLFMAPAAAAQEVVRVSATHFPPFYTMQNDGRVSGLGIDLIEAMNSIQDEFEFTVVPAPPRRRHQMFDEGRYDASFFDHLEWGWEGKDVEATDVYLTGGEVFITRQTPGRDQSFFYQPEQKKMAVILGYHYSFADFDPDPALMRERFDVTFTDSQNQIIKLVLSDRVEIGIITETYLKQYFQRNLTARSRILISDDYDQAYNFRSIVKKDGPISAAQVEEIITLVRIDERFQWIKDKYGINW